MIGFFVSGCANAPGRDGGGGSSAEVRPAGPATAKESEPSAENDSAEQPAAAMPARTEGRDAEANSPTHLIAQLNDATREIATLRAANAKLKAAKPVEPKIVRETVPEPADEKLTTSLRSYAQFKKELAGFLADIEKLRADNSELSGKLKEGAAETQEMKAMLAKLEGELKTEKEGRAQAEQTTAKLREQLRAVAAAVTAAGLSLDEAPAGGVPTARLETSKARLRAAATAERKHVVKDGDTLEKIADFYYGDPSKWLAILEANRGRVPLDGTLPAGLELEIPAK